MKFTVATCWGPASVHTATFAAAGASAGDPLPPLVMKSSGKIADLEKEAYCELATLQVGATNVVVVVVVVVVGVVAVELLGNAPHPPYPFSLAPTQPPPPPTPHHTTSHRTAGGYGHRVWVPRRHRAHALGHARPTHRAQRAPARLWPGPPVCGGAQRHHHKLQGAQGLPGAGVGRVVGVVGVYKRWGGDRKWRGGEMGALPSGLPIPPCP